MEKRFFTFRSIMRCPSALLVLRGATIRHRTTNLLTTTLTATWLTATGLNAYGEAGSSITLGPTTNHHAFFAADTNPAMTSFMVADSETLRLNYGPAFSLLNELGNVDNFVDDLEDLIDLLDDSAASDEPVDETLARFNSVLELAGEHGYSNTHLNIRLPILPLYMKLDDRGRSISIDYGFNANIGARVLDEELQYDAGSDTFQTSSSLYLKSGEQHRISLSYSQPMWSYNEMGDVYIGARLNYFRLSLSKQVMPFQEFSDDISETIRDTYDQNQNTTSSLSVDVGLVWNHPRYRIGFSLLNINEPDFDYGAVGTDCARHPDGSLSRTNCNAATAFVNAQRIDATETHTKHARAQVDASYRLTGGLWLSGSYDLAEYADAAGFEHQWLNASLAYQGKGKIFSAARIGYRDNTSSSGVAALTTGFTLFKSLSLDLVYGLDSIEVDGESAPRSFGFAFSITEAF